MKTTPAASIPAAALLLLAACGEATPAGDVEPQPDETAPVAVEVPEMPGEEVMVPADEVDTAPEPEQIEEALPEEMLDETAPE